MANGQLVKGVSFDWIGEVHEEEANRGILQQSVEQVMALEKMAVDSRAGVYDEVVQGEEHMAGDCGMASECRHEKCSMR